MQIKTFESGQVLLVVVLIMVVVLTVGLSVVTRTITSVRTSQEDASSQRAFSAAEAGIEQIINSSSSGKLGELSVNGPSFNVTSSTAGASDKFLVNNYLPVGKNDGADVWLADYPNYGNQYTGNLTVFWGEDPNVTTEVCSEDPQVNTMPAIEIVLIQGSPSNPTMSRYAYDFCGLRAATNNFSTSISAGQTVLGKRFAYRVVVPITSGIVMRVVPLYSGTKIGLSTNNVNLRLPAQGQLIESTGTAGDTQRKIQVFRGFPKVPNEFFSYGIFSP